MVQFATIGRDLYLPEPATVVSKSALTAAEMLFEIRLDSGAELNHMPGQFVEVTVPGVGEIPISVSSSPDRQGTFELVVRRVGRVTTAMHGRGGGDKLGIRGPFGTHFPVDGALKGRNLLFIAGGIGLAPLRSAIHYVLNHRQDYGEVTILYGTKVPAERLFLDELADWSRRPDVNFQETADQPDAGWKGHTGVVTTLLPREWIAASKPLVVACGPPVMYKFVAISLYAAAVTNESIYLSLERRMKCGVGKCGHCQIDGLYVCMEGPVFHLADLAAVQEAI
jgi:sulfhydrogenase subunit gamma (sulfur reductase)